MTTMTATDTQVYEVFIKAAPEAIWEAITTPEFTRKYFYGVQIEVTQNGRRSAIEGGPSWDEDVLEWEPPRRLVHAWRAMYDPELAVEQPSRVTWEIAPQDGGIAKLTVVHDRLEGAPRTAESVAGGWMLVLSGLKTLLETGRPLAG